MLYKIFAPGYPGVFLSVYICFMPVPGILSGLYPVNSIRLLIFRPQCFGHKVFSLK